MHEGRIHVLFDLNVLLVNAFNRHMKMLARALTMHVHNHTDQLRHRNKKAIEIQRFSNRIRVTRKEKQTIQTKSF